jgi:hypothetical protein
MVDLVGPFVYSLCCTNTAELNAMIIVWGKASEERTHRSQVVSSSGRRQIVTSYYSRALNRVAPMVASLIG